MELSDILTTVHGKALTVEDVLEHIKAHGIFRNAIYELIELEVINLEAKAKAVVISQDELNDYLNDKREALGLADAVAINDYCAWLGITYSTWVNTMRNELTRRKLRTRLITNDMVDQYFGEHGTQLKNVSIARIVATSRTTIETVHAQLREGTADFGALARKYSIETATQNVGGYVGTLRPGMLPLDVDKAVFSARTNDIVGPFQSNGRWALYKVVHVEYGELSEELRQQIAESLFEHWLTESTHQARA